MLAQVSRALKLESAHDVLESVRRRGACRRRCAGCVGEDRADGRRCGCCAAQDEEKALRAVLLTGARFKMFTCALAPSAIACAGDPLTSGPIRVQTQEGLVQGADLLSAGTRTRARGTADASSLSVAVLVQLNAQGQLRWSLQPLVNPRLEAKDGACVKSAPPPPPLLLLLTCAISPRAPQPCGHGHHHRGQADAGAYRHQSTPTCTDGLALKRGARAAVPEGGAASGAARRVPLRYRRWQGAQSPGAPRHIAPRLLRTAFRPLPSERTGSSLTSPHRLGRAGGVAKGARPMGGRVALGVARCEGGRRRFHHRQAQAHCNAICGASRRPPSLCPPADLLTRGTQVDPHKQALRAAILTGSRFVVHEKGVPPTVSSQWRSPTGNMSVEHRDSIVCPPQTQHVSVNVAGRLFWGDSPNPNPYRAEAPPKTAKSNFILCASLPA
jgi:hypothetical protein